MRRSILYLASARLVIRVLKSLNLLGFEETRPPAAPASAGTDRSCTKGEVRTTGAKRRAGSKPAWGAVSMDKPGGCQTAGVASAAWTDRPKPVKAAPSSRDGV